MNYDLRPLELDAPGLERAAALLRLVFPHVDRFQREYLEWLYVRNPAGVAVGCNAYDESGALVGHNATIRIRARLHGVEHPACLSLNTAVHPEHRGQGLFSRVMRFNLEEARRAGASHVVGVANANSVRGFEKLGFANPGKLDVRLCCSPPLVSPNVSVDWERIWTPADLEWRLAHPYQRYTQSTVNGALVVTTRTRYPLLDAIVKIEHDAGNQRPARALPGGWPLLPRLWFGLGPRFRFARARHWSVPERLRPSPFHMIFYDFATPARTPSGSNVHFEAIDFDVI